MSPCIFGWNSDIVAFVPFRSSAAGSGDSPPEGMRGAAGRDETLSRWTKPCALKGKYVKYKKRPTLSWLTGTVCTGMGCHVKFGAKTWWSTGGYRPRQRRGLERYALLMWGGKNDRKRGRNKRRGEGKRVERLGWEMRRFLLEEEKWDKGRK